MSGVFSNGVFVPEILEEHFDFLGVAVDYHVRVYQLQESVCVETIVGKSVHDCHFSHEVTDDGFRLFLDLVEVVIFLYHSHLIGMEPYRGADGGLLEFPRCLLIQFLQI